MQLKNLSHFWKSFTEHTKCLDVWLKNKSWLEQFAGGLCLIHDAYGQELRAINSADPIRSFRNYDQTMTSKRLFHFLQQNFTGYSKIQNLIKSQIFALGITESNGFELLRSIRKEFSSLSRSEALGYREQCISFRVKKSDHLPNIVRKCRQKLNLIQCCGSHSPVFRRSNRVWSKWCTGTRRGGTLCLALQLSA